MKNLKRLLAALIIGLCILSCDSPPNQVEMRCEKHFALNYGSTSKQCKFENSVAFYWNRETKQALKKLDVEVLNFYVDGELLNNTFLNKYFVSKPNCYHLDPNVISFTYHEPYETNEYFFRVLCNNNRELFHGSFVLNPAKSCKSIKLEWNYPIPF